MNKFLIAILLLGVISCGNPSRNNKTAIEEQAKTEANQRTLNINQPAPKLDWSLERDNLIKRFKLMNDRGTLFYMYVFLEGYGVVGYYMVNKVSSVNSQLTNPEQVIYPTGVISTHTDCSGYVVPSPAEDGSYGTNGEGVFGFDPNGVYIEHNMRYMTSTIPLNLGKEVRNIITINVTTEAELKKVLKVLK